jgi:YHS domain-containing protein
MRTNRKETIMRSALVVSLGLLALTAAGPIGIARAAEDATDHAQTTCPITGKAIDRSVYTDALGKRVYFCCSNCIAKFEADPAGNIAKLEAQGVVLEAAPHPQTRCPIMGGEIDRSVYTDVDGKRVYFCCPACIPKFNEDPQAQIQRMEAEGIQLEATPAPQTLCPVMDQPIDSAFFTDYEGQRIYFCCASCIETFKKDPQTYLEKLRAQGVTLEPAPQPDGEK